MDEISKLKALIKRSIWCIECMYEEFEDTDSERDKQDMKDFLTELKEAIK